MADGFKLNYKRLVGTGALGAALGGTGGYTLGDAVGAAGAQSKVTELNDKYKDAQRRAASAGVRIPKETHEIFQRASKMALHNHIAKRRQTGAAIGALLGGAVTAHADYKDQKAEYEKKLKKKLKKEAGYLGSATSGALLGGVNSIVKTLPLNLAVHGASHAYYHKKGVAKFNGKRMAKDVGDTAAFVGAVGAISGAYSGLHAQYQINQAKKKGDNQYGNVVRYNSGDINPSGDE